jgi:hypothetical protein
MFIVNIAAIAAERNTHSQVQALLDQLQERQRLFESMGNLASQLERSALLGPAPEAASGHTEVQVLTSPATRRITPRTQRHEIGFRSRTL